MTSINKPFYFKIVFFIQNNITFYITLWIKKNKGIYYSHLDSKNNYGLYDGN